MLSISETGVTVVDVWADWCVPCKKMFPVLEEAAAERPDILWEKLEAEASEENMNFCRENGVMSFPTLLVFKDGERVGSIVGAMSKEALIQKVDEIVS